MWDLRSTQFYSEMMEAEPLGRLRQRWANNIVTWRLKAGMVEPGQTSIAKKRLGNHVYAATNIDKDLFPLQQITGNESLPGSKLPNTRFP
jgi:hypothetical protein